MGRIAWNFALGFCWRAIYTLWRVTWMWNSRQKLCAYRPPEACSAKIFRGSL